MATRLCGIDCPDECDDAFRSTQNTRMWRLSTNLYLELQLMSMSNICIILVLYIYRRVLEMSTTYVKYVLLHGIEMRADLNKS